MGMTMSQKILAAHAGLSSVRSGQLVQSKIDLVHGNDITSPVAIREFQNNAFKKVFDPYKVVFVMDHFTPNKDIKTASMVKQVREFAKEQKIKHYYDVGQMGIEHALIPEKGLIGAGELSIGADSHTCTYGALGAFSTGVGSTDMAAAMATGCAWFKTPAAMRIQLTGQLSKWVSGKDLILHIIGKIGVDGALYQSMEFIGEGVSSLSMDDRFTIANMAIEAGAKNGIFAVDDKTIQYMQEHGKDDYSIYAPDGDAEYVREICIHLDDIRPTVAFPHLPENAKTIDESPKLKIDQVVIGSCTNGRLSDMAIAAEILRDRKVASNVRAIIIPATQQVYIDCIRLGYMEIFIEAGCAVSTPTCGPCLGGYMGILADGERAVSTTNRNFVGRMGHQKSEVYLASPAVAAASAVNGYLSSPESLK